MNKIDYYDNIMTAADFTFENDDYEIAVSYIPAEDDLGIKEDLDISIFNDKKEEVTWDIPHEEFLAIQKTAWKQLDANREQDLMDEAFDKFEDERLNRHRNY